MSRRSDSGRRPRSEEASALPVLRESKVRFPRLRPYRRRLGMVHILQQLRGAGTERENGRKGMEGVGQEEALTEWKGPWKCPMCKMITDHSVKEHWLSVTHDGFTHPTMLCEGTLVPHDRRRVTDVIVEEMGDALETGNQFAWDEIGKTSDIIDNALARYRKAKEK